MNKRFPRFEAILRRINIWKNRVVGLEKVSAESRLKIEIVQMDTRARMGPIMAFVGEIVMIALLMSFRGQSWTWKFYAFAGSISLCYGGIIFASWFWLWKADKKVIFKKFQIYYVFIQFVLGVSWANLLMAGITISNEIQRGQIYAIIIGLVSTSVFSGPAIYSISFWFPIVLITSIFLLSVQNVDPYTIYGIISYYALTIFAIVSLNRKLVDREIFTIDLLKYKEDAEILLREFQDGAGDWFWEINKNFEITSPSPRFCSASGRTIDQLKGAFVELFCDSNTKSSDLSSEDSRRNLENFFLRNISFQDHIVKIYVNDVRRSWELSGKPVYDENNYFSGFRGVARDITEVEYARQKIEQLALYDSLTGIQNRASFNIRLNDLYNQNNNIQTYLLCVDLDHFKEINDTYGHSIGDKLLSAVGKRIQNIIRHPIQAFRIGGDEFTVLISGLVRKDVEIIAQRIIDHLSSPYSIDEIQIIIGACIGIASFPGDSSSTDVLHHRADLALYRAKIEGRRTYRFFDIEKDSRFDDVLSLQSDLVKAIERGEFSLAIQPIVEIRSGNVISAEALLRWKHPARGDVGPDIFIPILERTGHIKNVGYYLIESVARVIQNIRQNISISINLSPVQLADKNLPNKIKEEIVCRGIDPGRIHFEVTENIFIRNDKHKLSILVDIKDMGFNMSLDDFGTGFASMQLLHEFEFDILKIDRSFIHGESDDFRLNHILETMIKLGNKLNMRVIGEGVETQSQVNKLIDFGCSEAQGFFFFRPMSESDFVEKFALCASPPS